MVESALLKELSMTKDKLAGYEGLQKHIEREAQVFADEAVGRWKVLNARSK